MILSRLMLATSEARGYSNAASQTLQAYALIGSSYNRDGRGAFLALERKYQTAGVYRTQELREQFVSLGFAADHVFDPANVIQDMHWVCTELAVYIARWQTTERHAGRPPQALAVVCHRVLLVCQRASVHGKLRADPAHVLDVVGRIKIMVLQ